MGSSQRKWCDFDKYQVIIQGNRINMDNPELRFAYSGKRTINIDIKIMES